MLLFRFPFVVATVQGLIAIALLLWATMARFGAPQSAPPPLSAGRAGLLQNMAKLIEFTGHQQVMIRRYVQETVRDVARQLHAPRALAGQALIAWLQRVGWRARRDGRLRRADATGRRIARGAPTGSNRPWFASHVMPIDGEGICFMDVQEIRAITEGVRGEVRKVVVGQDAVIDFMLTSLLVGGHILLEGVPGTAKTMITRAFAAGLHLQFGRIQFTPDLMPGDVLGTNLFNFQTNSFR